jgi:hypothetical protein
MALADYVACASRGQGIRARARETGAIASTVMRRVRQVEEAREHPDLAEVIAAAERVRADRLGLVHIGPAIAKELGQAPDKVRAELAGWRVCYPTGALAFVCGDLPTALVLASGERVGTIARAVLLAGLALGELAPLGEAAGRLRRLRFVPRPGPTPKPPEGLAALQSVRARSAGFFTLAHLEAARRLAALASVSDLLPGVLEAALAPLPRDARRAVEAVVCEGRGIEALERGEGWPARSGKLALRIGLEALDLPDPVSFPERAAA